MDAVRTGSSRAWLSALVEQTTEAVAVVDSQFRVSYVNRGALDLLGGTHDDYLGASAIELVHPDDLDRAVTALTAVGGGDQPLPGLIRLRRADASWHAYEVRPSPIDLGDDAGSVAMLVIRDNNLQEAHWRFLTDLSAGVDFAEAVDRFARGMTNDVDGPMAISFGDDGRRTLTGSLPATLAGVDAGGRVDAAPGGPWQAALHSAGAVVLALGDLPVGIARAAAAAGAGACVALAVDDPGSRAPMLITQWPPVAAHAPVLAGALERRPQQTLTLALERRESLRRLEEMAHHDELTGLVNRQRFYEVTEALDRTGVRYGICYIDLDRFKPVNDGHGHKAGDAVIEACGRRLRRLCRPGDIAARLGGDEFALALAGIDAAGLASVAARVVAGLGAPYEVGELVLDVGASVGAALSSPGTPAADVIAAADAALYAVKRSGRGTWQLAGWHAD